MADRDALRDDYVRRINRVLDHIDAHLPEPLRLETLAEVACFSPFHFHRIFRAMTGETAAQYVQRRRLEWAARQLRTQPHRRVTDIALECGFSSPAAFARAFSSAFGMSASSWRRDVGRPGMKNRKIGKTEGKIGKDAALANGYVEDAFRHTLRSIPMTAEQMNNVRVEDLDAMSVAYIRHIGPYQAAPELFGELFGRLFAWAGPRGLLRFPQTKIMSVYYDDPEVTDDERLRVDVCLTVPADTEVSGEIGKRDIPAGRYAIGRFETASDGFGASWDAMYKDWLPASGYLPEDRPCFEIYHNDYREHPEGKHIYDICIPVKRP